MKCIYCLKSFPKKGFKKREHVIPQCLGKFHTNNLILRNTVCDNCNQYFGDEVEVHLGRDSIVGIQRYAHGIKSKKLSHKHNRLRIEFADKEIKGLLGTIGYSKATGETSVAPVSQVGVFHSGRKGYVYFPPQEVPEAEVLRKVGYDLQKEISIITASHLDAERIISLLKQKGIEFRMTRKGSLPKAPLDKGKINIKISSRIDHIIMRSISKIAFNYLVFIKGKNYVLKNAFDGIRNFIRYDEGMSIEYFFPCKSSPVEFTEEFTEMYNIEKNNGHILLIQSNEEELLATIDLFITNNYMVRYCRNFESEKEPTIIAGHFFDTDAKRIYKLKYKSNQ